MESRAVHAGPSARGTPRTVPVPVDALGEGETLASLEAEVLKAEEERLLTAMRHLKASQEALAEEPGGLEEAQAMEENKDVLSRMAAKLVELREALARLEPPPPPPPPPSVAATEGTSSGADAVVEPQASDDGSPGEEVEVQPGVYVTMHGGRKLKHIGEGDVGGVAEGVAGVWL